MVLATSRRQAEAAASLVKSNDRELPAVLDASAADTDGTVPEHAAPWEYEGAMVGPSDPPNLQSVLVRGSLDEVETALTKAVHVVSRAYTTASGHQGYLEPQCWTATQRHDGGVFPAGDVHGAVPAAGPGGHVPERAGGVGSGLQVLRSDDDGATWRSLRAGWPEHVHPGSHGGAALDPEDPDVVYVGLSDGSIWRSQDGERFDLLLTDLPPVQAVTVVPEAA